jgi:hypothetical protein
MRSDKVPRMARNPAVAGRLRPGRLAPKEKINQIDVACDYQQKVFLSRPLILLTPFWY